MTSTAAATACSSACAGAARAGFQFRRPDRHGAFEASITPKTRWSGSKRRPTRC
jgi:hypothetical protein